MSMQYPALPKAAGEAAVWRLLDTEGPGGLLLAVYQDLDDKLDSGKGAAWILPPRNRCDPPCGRCAPTAGHRSRGRAGDPVG